MAKQNKPITEKQVATFTKLIESGMLEHLEAQGLWDVVDTVDTFLNNFREPKDNEILATPSKMAEFFVEANMYRDCYTALCRKVRSEYNDSAEELELLELVAEEFDIPEYMQDPDEQDEKFERDIETLLEQDTNYQNRERLQDILRLSHHASTETIINEIKSRIE